MVIPFPKAKTPKSRTIPTLPESQTPFHDFSSAISLRNPKYKTRRQITLISLHKIHGLTSAICMSTICYSGFVF
nr:hypothetical protein Iba_chr15cCG9170 [Ipomoea batatas]